MKQKPRPSAFTGAVFLMATAAIGPGFITQTTVFTQKLFTSFGFVILLSLLLDIIVQLNIWRIIAATRSSAYKLANSVFPGSGVLLTLLIAAGGLIFNIGNIGGCGLGMQTLFGLSPKVGAVISGALAILLFLYKEFGRVMDWFTKCLGVLMMGLTLYTALKTNPPLVDVVQHAILPERIDFAAIITLVGGTVGGYISFAGANRMLDTLPQNEDANLKSVNKAAVSGIALAGVMRIFLYLAAIGVVSSGVVINVNNPAATVFESSAGVAGLKIFGIVLWCAAITSVVGASYTSVSFLQHLHPVIFKYRQWCIVAFICMATLLFYIMVNPVYILVTAGAINGFVLPFALALMLLAIQKYRQNYSHSKWLTVSGWLVVLLLLVMSVKTIIAIS